MEDSKVIELVKDISNSNQVAGMEVIAVAILLFGIGLIVGILIFDIFSKRWFA